MKHLIPKGTAVRVALTVDGRLAKLAGAYGYITGDTSGADPEQVFVNVLVPYAEGKTCQVAGSFIHTSKLTIVSAL